MRGVLGHKFRLSTLWLALFLGILGGLGLARVWPNIGPHLILMVLPFLAASLIHRKLPAVILIITLGLLLGLWRGAVYIQKLAAFDPIYHQKVTIQVTAMNDALYGKTKQLSFDAGDIVLEDGQKLTGKIQLSGFGANAVYEGDRLVVSGKMRPGYGAFQGKMSFAQMAVIEQHPSLLAEIRRRFVAGAQTALPEPLAPFIMGLLVGQRANLPQETKDDLQTVGLTHIIAVSGANLTIILQATRRVLGNKSKRISTFLTLALMGVFLVLAGASASIVRAAMVSFLSIVAAYYGRNFKPLNLILFAAAITAMANPVYLWSDLSWYLSFLAFFGVMILAPLIRVRWPEKWQNSLIMCVALETICAELLTLPFVLHIFGQMSRVGLLANILVVTLIPLAMLLGLIAGLAGMFVSSLAGWFSWPATIVLNYMLDVAHILAGLPNNFVEGIGLSLWQMLILYLIIALVTTMLWYKNPNKNAIITDMTEPKTKGLLA